MKKRILAMLMCLVLAIAALSTSAFAAKVIKSGKCGDNLTWTLDENNVLTISGNGEMYDYDREKTSPWYDCSIDSVVIENGVTGIGDYSFWDCSKITELRIPASVDNIGNYAFSGCENLQKFVVDGDNNSYCSDESGLLYSKDMQVLKCAPMAKNEMTLAASVNEIAYDAFCEGDYENIIRFTGDVINYYGTTIYDNTIYYPANNPTWTEAIKGAYGSNTWIEYTPDENVSAASGTFGENLTWKFTDDGVLTISGEGSMGDFDNYLVVPWYRYREETYHIVIEDGVTDIGNYAFYQSNAVDVRIPDSVTKIGDYAFYFSCFKEITIPDSVATIGEQAFHFSDINKINIPDSVISIGEGAFQLCTEITEITIPGSVKSIGANAFDHCRKLADVTLEKGIVEIGAGAFWYCDVLTNIDIPDSVEIICESAFRECYALTEITIPKSVTSIGNNAFSYCESLEKIVVDKGNQYYSSDENGVLFNKNMTELLQAPIKGISGKYTIPDSVTCIKDYAFDGCDNLTEVEISASVNEIGDFAFFVCSNLNKFIVDEDNSVYSSDEHGVLFNKDKTTLVLVPGTKTEYVVPDGVTTIDDYAFFGMYLAKITVPASVTNVGGYVIRGDAVQEIHFMGDAPNFHWTNFVTTVPVKVYYPENNSTWINLIQNSQYDDITWIPYTISARPQGDVNGDGEVTNADLIMVARYIVELYSPETVNDIKKYGDMDGDGNITNADLISIARIIVGL